MCLRFGTPGTIREADISRKSPVPVEPAHVGVSKYGNPGFLLASLTTPGGNLVIGKFSYIFSASRSRPGRS